jgi:hypothetical protein
MPNSTVSASAAPVTVSVFTMQAAKAKLPPSVTEAEDEK